MEIYFNSKSKEYNKLSNFYGGVEACFMKDRFLNPEIKALFNKFETCDSEQFIYYLKELQPEKKDWTEAKLYYWFYIDSNDGKRKPIRGVLSKLAGTAVKDTPTGKRRLKILKKLAKFNGVIKIKTPLSHKDKQTLMFCCLYEKFKKNEYKKLLLSTNNVILHERPMRGGGNDWTYPGGDLLGQLLMKVRDNIKLI